MHNRGDDRSALRQDASPGLACSLTAQETAERLEDWHHATGLAVDRKRVDGGWRLRFFTDERMASTLADLAVREHECCPFFSFTLTIGRGPEGKALTLDLKSTPAALPLLDELIGQAGA